MDEKLTIERFGEIMDDFLKENEINMLLTLPEGTIEPKISDNTGMGCIVQFYILLAALPEVFEKLFEVLLLDKNKKEELVDDMLGMVKKELIERGDIGD